MKKEILETIKLGYYWFDNTNYSQTRNGRRIKIFDRSMRLLKDYTMSYETFQSIYDDLHKLKEII